MSRRPEQQPTATAVRVRAKHTQRPFGAEEDAAIVAGIRAGRSHREIAESIGRPKSSIFSRLQMLRGARRIEPEECDDTGVQVTVREPMAGVRIVTHRVFEVAT